MTTLFDGIGDVDAEAAALVAAAERRPLPAGASSGPDAFPGAAFVVVEEGFVVVRRATAARRRAVLCHAGPGALVPAPGQGETLDALLPAAVTVLAESAYVDLLARPTATLALSDALRATVRQQQESLAIFASVHPVERVERKLLQLARDHGRVVMDGVRLDVPLTHELLAEMVGCARETVSRAVERLEASGLVVKSGRSYRLRVEPDRILRA